MKFLKQLKVVFEDILEGLGLIPKDKLLHFIIGIIIFDFLFLFVDAISSLFLVILVGLFKELYDVLNKEHKCSFFDFFATFSGGLIQFIFIYIKFY